MSAILSKLKKKKFKILKKEGRAFVIDPRKNLAVADGKLYRLI